MSSAFCLAVVAIAAVALSAVPARSAEPMENCWRKVWSLTPPCAVIDRSTADNPRLCIFQSNVSVGGFFFFSFSSRSAFRQNTSSARLVFLRFRRVSVPVRVTYPRERYFCNDFVFKRFHPCRLVSSYLGVCSIRQRTECSC